MGYTQELYDYIIVGAGISGVVVAARLRETISSASILLLEAGGDETNFDFAKYAKFISSVRGSRIDYSFDSIPQKHLDSTPKKQWAGRALSGGGAINVGAWTRGPSVDYDRWAQLTEDDSWDYKGLLPYFAKSETYHNVLADPSLHGQRGPMQIKLMSDVRNGKFYPGFKDMKAAWQQMDPSLKWKDDTNDGNPLGMGECASAFIEGERQFPHQAPRDQILAAMKKDGIEDMNHKVLHPQAVRQEMYTLWMAGRSAALLEQLGLKNDGSQICTSTYNLHPTSRGSVALSSANPMDPPLIDPNYYGTETDRVIYRDALRKLMRVVCDTEAGKELVTGEVPPNGFPALSPESSNEDIDRRVGAFGETGSHPNGTCAMGKTVDSSLRVKGVQRLRVDDASVFPSPIASHIQAAVYAVAEKGADLIVAGSKA